MSLVGTLRIFVIHDSSFNQEIKVKDNIPYLVIPILIKIYNKRNLNTSQAIAMYYLWNANHRQCAVRYIFLKEDARRIEQYTTSLMYVNTYYDCIVRHIKHLLWARSKEIQS